MDVDSDGVTDLLLVGAPMFMSDMKREEGRVYVFSVTKVMDSNAGQPSPLSLRPYCTLAFNRLSEGHIERAGIPQRPLPDRGRSFWDGYLRYP